MLILRALVNDARIARQVAAVARKFARDVVRIRFHIGEDWTGDPSIFLRILLKDKATTDDRLGVVTRRVEDALRDKLQPRDMGLIAYFDFRAESEQAELKDPDWA